MSVESLLERVRASTTFDAEAIAAGDAVLVAAPDGVDVDDLIDALTGHVGGDDPVTSPTIRRYHPERDQLADPAHPSAGVALFVVDPASAADQEDERLMSALRASFGTVALVCTRIDAFWEWPRILRAQRAVLDPYEQLPVFAVSAAAALGGAADESGIPGLLDWLTAVVAAPEAVRTERARVAAAAGAVEYALGRTPPRPPADHLADEVQSLAARRRDLLGGRDRGRADRLAVLRVGIGRARTQTMGDIHAGIRALATAAGARSATVTRAGLAEHTAWLDRELAVLTGRIDAITEERIEEVATATLVGLDVSEEAPPPPDDEPVGVRRSPPTGGRPGEDALLMVIGASTGLGIGRLVVAPMAAVQTLQWFSMPLTLILGLGVAVWVIRMRRAASLRSEIRVWGSEVLSEARGRLEHRAGIRIGAAESRIGGQVARHHERRGRLVAEEVAAIDDRVRLLRAEASGAAASARATRQRLDELHDLHGALAGRAAELWAPEST